jgi:phenylalanine-4-hydroxylase
VIDSSTKYDHLFSHLLPNAVGDVKIFSKEDDYLIEQDYEAITDNELGVWMRLYEKLVEPLNRYASKEYLDGIDALGLSAYEWPNFSQLSPRIRDASGWEVTPVAGFLDEWLFFELNAERKFPVTDIVRQSERLEEKYAGRAIANTDEYTPEPDIFHDIRGHAPFLMNRAFGDFLADVGKLGHQILVDERNLGPELVAHNLKRLQNFAWWSYEFGIMKKQPESENWRTDANDMDHELYGSGIISGYDEVMNVVACSRGESDSSALLPFDMEEVVMTRFDYSDIQDRYYIIDSMESLYADFYDNQRLFFFEG